MVLSDRIKRFINKVKLFIKASKVKVVTNDSTMKEIEKLDNAISQYLEEENTDYALIIDGDWGSGKTHYLKHHLTESIDSNKYKIIYVSLFGVKEMSEIPKKIFLELYPSLNNKAMQTLGVFGKIIIQNLLPVFGSKGIDTKEESKLIDLAISYSENTLILIDDLERVYSDLLIEVIGYINQLTEHGNIKVIIATNEKEIFRQNAFDERDQERYKAYIEKIVRYNLKFNLDFSEVSTEIFKKADLDENMGKIILEAFHVPNNNNLRTLQFVSSISSKVKESIDKFTNDEELNERATFLAIYFLASLAIEMKTKTLSNEEARKLKTWSMTIPVDFSNWDMSKILVQETEENKKETIDKDANKQQNYFDKYWKGNQLMYFDSVLSYISDGYWNEDQFFEELKKLKDHLTSLGESKANQVLGNLNFYENLEDKELKEVAEQTLHYASKGEYKLKDYLGIFRIFLRLIKSELIDNKEEDVYDSITKGIENCSEPQFEHYITDFLNVKEEESDSVKRVFEKIIKKNEELKNLNSKESSMKHYTDMFNNPEDCLNRITKEDTILLPPLNNACSPKEFLNSYLNLSNYNKNMIHKIMYQRNSSHVQLSLNEIGWMEQLIDIISENIKNTSPSIAHQNTERLHFLITKLHDEYYKHKDHLD